MEAANNEVIKQIGSAHLLLYPPIKLPIYPLVIDPNVGDVMQTNENPANTTDSLVLSTSMK